MCILRGSPHHVFVDCKVVNPLRQQVADVFEHVKKVIETHPDTIVFPPGTVPAPQPHSGERASGSNDRMDVESVLQGGGQSQKRDQDKTISNKREVSLLFGMDTQRTCPNQCSVAEETTTSCVVRTSLRWVFRVTMNFWSVFRRALAREITAFRSVETAACIVDLSLEHMKMQHMRTSLMVSMVEPLRSYRHVERSFAILRGTTSPLPNHRTITCGRQRMLQRLHSDSFRRISDTTLDEGTTRSTSTGDVNHQLQSSSAMRAVG